MAGFEDLIRPNTNKLIGADDGKGYTFIDADTLRVDDEVDEDGKPVDLRLAGTDAPEIYHEWQGSQASQEVGAAETTGQTVKLANELGFTKVVRSGEKGKYGREIFDLVNPKTGESFSRRASAEGIQPIHHAYDDNQSLLKSREFAQALKTGAKTAGTYEPSEWDEARMDIEEAVQEEMTRTQQFKRQQEFSGEIGELGRLAKDPNLTDSQRYYLNQRIESLEGKAKADAQLTDRHQVSGHANNPLSVAWDQGLIGITEASYGILEMTGVTLGSEALTDIGENGIFRARDRIARHGNIVTNWEDVESVGNFTEYLGTNLAMSIPYMAISAGAAITAPITGGLSLTAPAAIYAGQTWNEMEGEKNAAIAVASGVAQAVLDKVGLDFIVKPGRATKDVLKQAVDALVKKGMNKKAAEATVGNAARREIAALAGDAVKIAKTQLEAKRALKDLVKKAAIGGAGEGVTEALQEATAYLGAVAGSDKVFDGEELSERLKAAAIAGTALGGTFGAAGKGFDVAAWTDVAHRLAPADAAKASLAEKYAAEETRTNGRIASVEELAADARARSESTPGSTLGDRVTDHNAKQGGRTALDKFTEKALNVASLWQGATRNIFTPELQSRSRSARVLADMFGGNLQRIFSGANFENSKHHRVSIYKNMVPEPRSFYELFTGRGNPNLQDKAKVADETYAALNAAVDKDGNFNPDLIPDSTPNKQVLVKLAAELQQLGDKMHADQAKHDPELGFVKNYLFKYKSLSKKAVHANKEGFKQALQDKYNYSAVEANKLTDEILNNNEVDDISQAFSVINGGIVPGSHRKRSLAMSEQAEFQGFMEPDLFANIATAAKSAARFTAHRDFIGKNGGVVAKLLDDMQAEGVPKSEVDAVAARMQDYLDAESGNYKRPTSDLGKSAIQLQKNFMMLTTLSGLPLATISSLVETMLVMRGLRSDQIFGKEGSLQAIGREGANTIFAGAREVATVGFVKEQKQPVFKSSAKEKLKDLGYYDWDVGAATVTGVTEVNAWQQRFYERFFKWTGLSGFTNFTRAARATVAGDYISDKVTTISDQRRSGEPRTREVQEAEEGLRNIGIDVDQMVLLSDKMGAGIELNADEEKFMADTTREATFSFINDAIALPQSQNRPLIYQDPRFALFTQFQGFIATFTANHIPKLWGEYVKRGTPAMKYNAFSVMATMIMMGFVSQHLKDLIKYGGSTPHLDTPEYLQRGIRGSGLLGTSERILDLAFPIYEQKTDGVGDWVFKTGSGESPALSHAGKIAKAGGKLIEGDVGNAAKYAVKSAPLTGPFSGLANYVGDKASAWNWKGGS